MYNGLVHAHSGLRWIVLVLMVATIAAAFSRMRSSNPTSMKKLSVFNLSAFHTQFLIGIILYFISPKVQFNEFTMSNDMNRFFAVEHISMMLVATVLVTIGHSRIKKGNHKAGFIFTLVSLLIVLASIPWPFRNLGAGWF